MASRLMKSLIVNPMPQSSEIPTHVAYAGRWVHPARTDKTTAPKDADQLGTEGRRRLQPRACCAAQENVRWGIATSPTPSDLLTYC